MFTKISRNVTLPFRILHFIWSGGIGRVAPPAINLEFWLFGTTLPCDGDSAAKTFADRDSCSGSKREKPLFINKIQHKEYVTMSDNYIPSIFLFIFETEAALFLESSEIVELIVSFANVLSNVSSLSSAVFTALPVK